MKEKQLKYLSIEEFATCCGVNSQVVLKWINKGEIKGVRTSEKKDYKIEIENLKKIKIEKKLKTSFNCEFQKKVLIIDDEQSIIESIEPLFLDNGFQILSTRSTWEAIFLIYREQPYILTLDLGMLDSSGIEVLKMINDLGLNQNIWIIIISAASESELRFAVDLGGDFYLQKPYNESDLNKIIKKISIGLNLKSKAA